MISPKGFLEPDSSNRPRMTAAQAHQVLKASLAALDLAMDNQQATTALIVLVKQTIIDAIASYPVDRSCRTCDYSTSDNHCLHYQQEIPADHLENGCDQHKDECGVPF